MATIKVKFRPLTVKDQSSSKMKGYTALNYFFSI